jgi:glycosyltransferase involved in cell wall biosynthesis
MVPAIESEHPVPRFSVIIPAYNAEGTIGRAVESVLAQGFEDWELVVCDDGSSDRTAEKIVSYQSPKIRVIRQANAGCASASNAAAREAKGEFLCILAADDEYEPDYLKSQDSFITAHPDADFYSCNATLIDASRGTTRLLRDPRARTPEGYSFAQMLTGNRIFGACTLRRSSFERAGGYVSNSSFYNEDYELWMRMLRAGMKHRYNPAVLYRYHLSGESRSADLATVWADCSKIVGRYADDEGLSAAVRRRARRSARHFEAASELARRLAEKDQSGGRQAALSTVRGLHTPWKRGLGAAVALVSPSLYWRLIAEKRAADLL